MPHIASAEVPSGPKTAGLVTLDGRSFPLRAAQLRARAEGGLAATTLTQEYANLYAEPLEVLYTMPLPADGAVAGYTFHLGSRTVRGTIERREKARADYKRALMEGKTAGLLEQERADTFTQSLGNVPPGTGVTVEIEVLHPLAFLPAAGGVAPLWEWRFPTVVGVRYEGAPGEVPDAERLDVPRADGQGTPVRIDAELRIDGGRTLVAEGARLDRDVVFTWSAAAEFVEASLSEGRGLPGDDGRYALLTVTPPSGATATFPRDLTILLDASGSMEGAPLAAAKAIVNALLGSLGEGDRFELLSFSSRVRELTSGVVPANAASVAAARKALEALRAGGGTEMANAVEKALAPLRGEAQRQVVLMTDGYIGAEARVVSSIRSRLPESSRLHVVGIGASPNRTLTRGASRAGRGIEILVGLGDDPRAAAERLVRGTAAPVLTGLRVRGSAVRGVAPERPRDVFAGALVMLFVELSGAGGVVEVEGRLAGSSEPWTRRFEVGAAASADEALPLGAFYGRERVEDLESEQEHGFDEAIEAAGLRHRIVTRGTSLVAISEDATVDPGDPRRRERLPVDLPYGVSAEGVGLMLEQWGGEEFRTRASYARPASFSGVFEDKLRIGGSPTEVVVHGRLLAIESGAIVFELEVPFEGIEILADRESAVVSWDRVTWTSARFDTRGHTRPGLHPAGVTVRVRLVIEKAGPGSGPPAAAMWTDSLGRTVEVRLA